MKAKIASILARTTPNNASYVRAAALVPDVIDESNWHLAHFPKNAVTQEEVRLASSIRTAARKSQLDEIKMRNHAKRVIGTELLEDEGEADEDGHTDKGINASDDENIEADEDTDPTAD